MCVPRARIAALLYEEAVARIKEAESARSTLATAHKTAREAVSLCFLGIGRESKSWESAACGKSQLVQLLAHCAQLQYADV